MNMHLSVMMFLNVLELGAISTIFCMKAPKRRGWVRKASLCFAAMALYVFCFPMERLSYFAVHLPIVVTAFVYITIYPCAKRCSWALRPTTSSISRAL